jgi:hypothetical protein
MQRLMRIPGGVQLLDSMLPRQLENSRYYIRLTDIFRSLAQPGTDVGLSTRNRPV